MKLLSFQMKNLDSALFFFAHEKMLLKFAQKSYLLQNLIIKLVSAVHPSIEHNIDKIKMLKRAFFHCELEKIEGGYFEFGVYEGASFYSAINVYKGLRSGYKRSFFGFDSFDEGFKYFDGKDKHPFFKEGDFKSSYSRVIKRFKKFRDLDINFIPGYFENTVAKKKVSEICPDTKCAVIFIDCDLMNPANIALEFIKPILQLGSVIILDDYWAYKGQSSLGTCGALNNFLAKNKKIRLREYYTYGHGGMSFVVSAI